MTNICGMLAPQHLIGVAGHEAHAKNRHITSFDYFLICILYLKHKVRKKLLRRVHVFIVIKKNDSNKLRGTLKRKLSIEI